MNEEIIPEESQGQETKTQRPKETNLAMAIASLILGILAIVLSLFLLGGLLGIIGLLLGIGYLATKPIDKVMARWGVGLSIVGILATGGLGYLYYCGFKYMQKSMEKYKNFTPVVFEEWIGKETPDFTITDLDGKTIKLSGLKGRRVILDFWATWCPPCRKEIPHFIELRNKIKEEELAIFGLSQEDEKMLRDFAGKNNVNYPIVSIGKRDLPVPYSGIMSIPTTFFIDRNGIIQKVLVGYHSLEELKNHALTSDYKAPAPPTEKVAMPEKELDEEKVKQELTTAAQELGINIDSIERKGNFLLVKGITQTFTVFDNFVAGLEDKKIKVHVLSIRKIEDDKLGFNIECQ